MKNTFFSCTKNLDEYTDSMLFDSGNCVASADFTDEAGNKYEIDLRVVGDVSVYWKDEHYTCPSEFPEELRSLIKSRSDWTNNPDIYISNNNWFEYIIRSNVSEYSEGEMEDNDLSGFTSEEILKTMTDIITDYALRYVCHN